MSQRLLVVDPDDDESFNALLRHINFSIMEGRLTEKQKKWKRNGAVFLGFLGSWPDSPVYETGLVGVASLEGGSSSAWGVSAVVILTSALDKMPRNGEFLAEVVAPSRAVISMPKTESHQRALKRADKLIWGGSILASSIPIKLFLATEIERMNWVIKHSTNLAADLAPFIVYVGVLLIPYLLDAVFFNAFPLLKKAKAYINQWYYQDQRDAHPREEGQRNDVLEILRETAQLLAFVSDSERRQFCEDFVSDIEGSEEEKATKRFQKIVNFHKKHIKKLKSILIEDALINAEKLKWATRTAKGGGGLAFGVQSVLYYLLLDNLFGLVLGNGTLRTISKVFSVLLGSLGLNVAVSANVYGAIKNLALKLFGGDDPREDRSNSRVRGGVMLSEVGVGILRSLPLTVLFTILTNGWSLAPRLIGLTVAVTSASITNTWAYRWYNNLVSAAASGCRTLASKVDSVKRTCHRLADEIFLDLNYDHLARAHKVITREPDRGALILALPAPQPVVASSTHSSEASELHQKKVQEDEHKHNGDEDMKQSLASHSNVSSNLLSPQQPRSEEDVSEDLRLAVTKKSAPLSTGRIIGAFGFMVAYCIMLFCLLGWQVVPRVDSFLMGSPTNSTGNSTNSFYP